MHGMRKGMQRYKGGIMAFQKGTLQTDRAAGYLQPSAHAKSHLNVMSQVAR